jgi:PAS domain S-box-containing protein
MDTHHQRLFCCGILQAEASILEGDLAGLGWQVQSLHSPQELSTLDSLELPAAVLLLSLAAGEGGDFLAAALAYRQRRPAVLVCLVEKLDPAAAACLEGQADVHFLPPGAGGALLRTALHNAWQSFSARQGQCLEAEVERLVAERSAELQDLYDHAPVGYHSLDAAGQVVRVNQTELDWLGYTREEMVGHPFCEFIAPAYQAVFGENLPLLTQRGWLKDLESELVCKDGSAFPVLVNATAVLDDQGGYVMSRTTLVDRRESRQAAQALQKSEERLREVLDHSINAVYKMDMGKNTFEYLNPAFMRLTGLSSDDGYRMNWDLLELIHPEDRLPLEQTLQEIFARQESVCEMEYRLAHRDGGYRWILHRLQVVYSGEGQPLSAFGSLMDITERKEAEQELQRSEAKLREVLDYSINAVYKIDVLQNTFEYLNPAFARMTGLSLEEGYGLPGWGLLALVHADDRPVLERTLQDLLSSQVSSGELEFRLAHRDGGYRWFLNRFQIHYNSQGQPQSLFGSVVDVTERREAEQALRESEERYRLLFENMKEGFALHELVLDETGGVKDIRFLAVNAAYERHTGLNPRQLVGRTMLEVIPGASSRQMEAYIRVAQTGDSMDMEYFSTVYLRHLRTRAFSTQSGRFAVIVEDITERVLAENKLRESEERFRQVLDNSLDGSYKLNLKRVAFEYASPSFEAITGFAPEVLYQAQPSFLTDHIHPDDLPAVRLALTRDPDGPALRHELEYRFLHGDGSVHWHLNRFVILTDDQGKPDASVGSIIDITPHRLAEQALEKSEAILQSFFDGIQQDMGIFRARPEIDDLEFLRLNQAALKKMDILPGTLPGALASQHGMLVSSRRLWLEESRYCQEIGQPVQFEYLADLARGKWNIVSLNCIETGIFSFAAADITELKGLQFELEQLTGVLGKRVALRTEELSRANRELEQALRLREELLQNLSHELRTPLTGIMGVSEALSQGNYGPLNERQGRALAIIDTSSERLLKLVNNLLDMSMALAGTLTLKTAQVSASFIMQECLKQTQPAASGKRQQIEIMQDGQVEYFRADERRLEQILVLLLENAVKFTPEEGKIGLEFEADPAAGVVRWVVWDAGIGMPPEQQAQLFKMFVQGERGLTRRYDGLGLGLALVHELVKLHGGRIEVESAPGEGSCFTVSLPWAD